MSAGFKCASRRGRGFVLVAFTLALLLILGSIGLAFDIGRMYITRNEAQSFCDAAALSAVLKLDGTDTGFTNGRAAALATVKGWQFGTKPFDAANADISVTFGTSLSDDTYVETPTANLASYVYARVTVNRVTLPMAFIPVLTQAFTANIAARATAKQIPVTTPGNGHFAPFSPFARTTVTSTPPFPIPPSNLRGLPPSPVPSQPLPSYPNDPFNMKAARSDPNNRGGLYNLIYPNTNALDITNPDTICPDETDYGMIGVKAASGNDNRGYLYNEARNVTDTIVADILPDTYPLIQTGDQIWSDFYSVSHGAMHVEIISSLQDRVLQDNDSTTPRWWEYYNNGVPTGNGRRYIIVPINSGPCGALPPVTIGNGNNATTYQVNNSCMVNGVQYQPYQVIGWAEFFLLESSYYDNGLHGNNGACAEYLGPAVMGGVGPGGEGSGLFTVKLVQ